MQIQKRNKLRGKVISVDHGPHDCRITIELTGTPEHTAAIMKQSLVELGLTEGTEMRAEVSASHVVLGISPPGECACSS